MLMLLLICSFFKGSSIWHLDSIGVFQPAQPGEVLIASDGTLYYLNRAENTIHCFNADGRSVSQFGGSGEGPGEFSIAYRFFLEKQSLMVLDIMRGSVTWFDLRGKFLKRQTLPERKIDVVKVQGGWVYGDWNQFVYEPKGKSNLWWADDTFDNEKVLLEVTGRGAKGTFAKSGNQSIYSPISATPRLTVSADGRYAFAAEAHGFRIHVIDAATQNVVAVIARQEPTLEFNPDWANVRLNEVKAMMPDTRFQTNYPSYFPIVRNLWVHPENRLVIDRWTRDPAHNRNPIVLDFHGQIIEQNADWETQLRWVASWRNWAFISIWRDGEYSLARVPKEEATTYVLTNPLPAEE